MRAFPFEMTRVLLIAAALAMPGWGAGQALPSFTLSVVAPEPTGTTLKRHLELARYREVPDLDEAELEPPAAPHTSRSGPIRVRRRWWARYN